jgi:excisionase family DNA binding protein
MDPHPLETVLSYSHANPKQRKKLREQLIQLEREGLIRTWDDRKLRVGQEVDASIQAQLEMTEVFILLLSPAFLASDYCHGVEMQHALERHAEGSALVLPIITIPCAWQNSPVGKLVIAPTDGKPISNWRPVDAGWADAARLVREAVLEFRMQRFGPAAAMTSAGTFRGSPLMLSIEEAAELLRVGVNEVRSLIENGTLPSLRLGTVESVRRADLEACVDELIRKGSLERLRKALRDPQRWAAELDKDPAFKASIMSTEYQPGTFGAFLKDAASTVDAKAEASSVVAPMPHKD